MNVVRRSSGYQMLTGQQLSIVTNATPPARFARSALGGLFLLDLGFELGHDVGVA
jgi:hypothetical protein